MKSLILPSDKSLGSEGKDDLGNSDSSFAVGLDGALPNHREVNQLLQTYDLITVPEDLVLVKRGGYIVTYISDQPVTTKILPSTKLR